VKNWTFFFLTHGGGEKFFSKIFAPAHLPPMQSMRDITAGSQVFFGSTLAKINEYAGGGPNQLIISPPAHDEGDKERDFNYFKA
jgi:hypothetical protein